MDIAQRENERHTDAASNEDSTPWINWKLEKDYATGGARSEK